MRLYSVAVIDAADTPIAQHLASSLTEALSIVPAGGLALIAATSTEAPPDPRSVASWISTLHASLDLLPMQYGDHVETTAEAASILARRNIQLRALLDGVRGRTEYGIRVLVEPAVQQPVPQVATASLQPNGKGSGKSYLTSRAQRYALQDGIPTDLTPAVEAWLPNLGMPDLRVRLAGASRVVPYPAIHCLVPRARVAHFLERYQATRGLLPAPSIVTGPWAPFNFVSSVDASG